MRLIDADELRKAFKKSLFFTDTHLHYAREIIDNAPTVEERQAHWFVRDGYPHRVYCSLCQVTYSDTRWEVWKDGSLPRAYCPNCGAKMLPTLFKINEDL